MKEAETVLENYGEDLVNLKQEFTESKEDVKEKWQSAVNDIQEVKLTPDQAEYSHHTFWGSLEKLERLSASQRP